MFGRIVALAIVATLCRPSAGAQKRTDLGELPQCSASQDNDWATLNTELKAVEVVDPRTANVNQYSAGRFGFAGLYLFPYNWLPMSATKQTMCGRLQRFDWNPLLKEQDWNLRIIPSGIFEGVFSDAKQFVLDKDKNQVWSCDPKSEDDIERHQCGDRSGHAFNSELYNCFEAELTPRKDMFDNRWFSHSGVPTGSGACSAIVDYDLCVYGPFVTESVHGNRPEIHPLEAMWWRNAQKAAPGSKEEQDWTLFHGQDASDRYKDKSAFAPEPSDQDLDWAPWAESPRVADFRIAIEVPAKPDAPVQFNSDEYYSSGVVQNEPGQGERTYIAAYHGTDILQVNEKQEKTNHYQVRLAGMCITPQPNVQRPQQDVLDTQDPHPTAVRMFVIVRSTVGPPKQPGSSAEVGFHALHVYNAALNVTTAPSLAEPLIASSATLSQRGRDQIFPDSVHAVKKDGRLQLFEVLQRNKKNLIEEDLTSTTQEVALESLLPQEARVAMFSRVLSVRHTLRSATQGTDVLTDKASKLLAGYLGVKQPPSALAKPVAHTIFAAAPQFALLRNGTPAWEDGSEFLSDFNAKIARSGQKGILALLDNTNPQASWSFQGFTCGKQPEKGCNKRTKVKVFPSRPPSVNPGNFIYVDQDIEGDVPRFHVYFPNWGFYRDSLLLLVATGSMKDPTTGELRQTTLEFYNIAVPVKDSSDAEAERVVADLAGLLNIAPEKLAGGPIPNVVAPFAQNARYRQAEMLRLNIKHAAQGEVIEPATMAVFLEAARNLARQP
jgi:hypothetical protein